MLKLKKNIIRNFFLKREIGEPEVSKIHLRANIVFKESLWTGEVLNFEMGKDQASHFLAN